MAAPRRVAGVSVGVNRTGVLETLTAAASSAIGFNEWLLSQRSLGVNVDSTLLTDKDGSPVTYRNVVDAVKEIVDRRACDALFLYFCGHGVMPNPYEEHFLLSDVKNYETEAVNLNQSIQDAKYCGLSHVVIIYDACRTSAEGDLRRIGGRSIIKPRDKVQPGHVDVFMACGPDQSAYLIPRAKQAFFTSILLDILRAKPPEIVEAYRPQLTYMIPSKRLEKLLYREVPKLAGAANPPFDQTPAIGSQSDLPECFAVVSPPDVEQAEPAFAKYLPGPGRRARPKPPQPPGPPLPSDVVQWHADRLLRGAPAAELMPGELSKVAQTSGFDQAVQMTN